MSALSTVLLVCCIAAPHVLYAAIWLQPELWRKQFKDRSVHTFAKVASSLKVIQFSAMVLWIVGHTGQLSSLVPSSLNALRVVFSLACIGTGQVLNIAIYRAIGENGVYYGFKLGKPVPWHHGFPFNVVSHPQYVGSVLTIWGAGGLYWSNLPAGSIYILLYWSSLYIATGLQEQYL